VKSANLDLLRAIAVLSVYFSHLFRDTGLSNPGSLGRFGVILFFVHTSLVLNASLERLEMTGFGKRWRLTIAFWIRRFFRIYPLSVVFVALTAVFHIPAESGSTYMWLGVKGFLANLALVQNLCYTGNVLGTLWTLPLEVQMYGILPFAYLVVRRKTRYGVPALWILSVLMALTFPRISGRFWIFRYAPCFTSGILAFDLRRTAKWKLPAWTWLPAILTIILLFGPFDNISLLAKLPKAWLLSLLLGVVSAHVQESTWTGLNTAAHWVAEYSYGIYLSHLVVLWIVIDVLVSWPIWTRVLVLVGASVGVPILCHRLIEKPFIGWGASLAQLLRHQDSAEAPASVCASAAAS
jgi:peptidoglycan/LPS O-acetylase OafA/YrhL